jgi:hypothetical protein
VEPVENLGTVINSVLRRDLQTAHPWVDAEKPTKRDRRDFYTWLLGLRPGARLIRYGCDENFNKLEGKKPRRFVPSDWKQPSKREEELKLRYERRVRRELRSKHERLWTSSWVPATINRSEKSLTEDGFRAIPPPSSAAPGSDPGRSLVASTPSSHIP